MRYWENCGAEVGETTNFCPNCGAAQRPDLEIPAGPPPRIPETGRVIPQRSRVFRPHPVANTNSAAPACGAGSRYSSAAVSSCPYCYSFCLRLIRPLQSVAPASLRSGTRLPFPVSRAPVQEKALLKAQGSDFCEPSNPRVCKAG